MKKAGLRNPGRTTWCGLAIDGTAVFTIWDHDIRQIDGRFFAWRDHDKAKLGFGGVGGAIYWAIRRACRRGENPPT
jgi:hypothetical protein